jgi:hypothetical protein
VLVQPQFPSPGLYHVACIEVSSDVKGCERIESTHSSIGVSGTLLELRLLRTLAHHRGGEHGKGECEEGDDGEDEACAEHGRG